MQASGRGALRRSAERYRRTKAADEELDARILECYPYPGKVHQQIRHRALHSLRQAPEAELEKRP
jgi:hypothetical protein